MVTNESFVPMLSRLDECILYLKNNVSKMPLLIDKLQALKFTCIFHPKTMMSLENCFLFGVYVPFNFKRPYEFTALESSF